MFYCNNLSILIDGVLYKRILAFGELLNLLTTGVFWG